MEDIYKGVDVSSEQRAECKKAFFAVAMALMVKMEQVGEFPEPIAIPIIQIIRQDLISTCEKFCEGEDSHESDASEKPSNN